MNNTNTDKHFADAQDATAEDYEGLAERLLAAESITLRVEDGVSLKCRALAVEKQSDGYEVELAILR